MTRHPIPALIGTARLFSILADLLGHVAALSLVVLTVALTLGVGLRWVKLDSAWTYDVGLFALMWVAFVGAAYCALRDFHVTAGISLEHFIKQGHRLILIIRYLILVVFLAIFLFSAWNKFIETLLTHQTTVDSMRWELWIAQISAPIGIAGWLLADLGRFIRKMIDPDAADADAAADDFSV